ncbi:MAG TPA: sulfatase-like hydrolase/transferase [Thermoanaerobaculia bacterium]|nr:sulfatase-like hydrolase/transferase [Thermoanaerobaculia bacterium]
MASISTANGTLTDPNIVIFISDETRFPQHWPADWVANHLPTWQKLANNGLTFTNAFTAACECSPSRASFLTSTYPEENGVRVTFNKALPTTMNNLADVLGTVKYPVFWKGKWHLSFAKNGGDNWGPDDAATLQTNYRMQGWNPPDAGNFLSVGPTLGGGTWNNDDRFVTGVAHNGQQAWGTGVLDFLASAPTPFCLVVSLVNPHDVFLYPDANGGDSNVTAAGYDASVLSDVGIPLPTNQNDNLSTKPSVQLLFQQKFESGAPLTTSAQFLNYVNFYAYLHTLSDQLFGSVYDALCKHNLLANTLIIRMADHGEMALSHNLREKMYTAYEEAIHVPLIYSNPTLWPAAQTTDALVSSLDLVPTLAAITGSTNTSTLRGRSYLDVLQGTTSDVQDNVIYTFDDQFGNPPPSGPGQIRCIRTKTAKYAVYFDSGSNFEYEMYDLTADPGEMTNLLYGTPSSSSLEMWKSLHGALTARLKDLGAFPHDATWPTDPWST